MPQLDLLTWETQLLSVLLCVVVGYLVVNHFILPFVFTFLRLKSYSVIVLKDRDKQSQKMIFVFIWFDFFFKKLLGCTGVVVKYVVDTFVFNLNYLFLSIVSNIKFYLIFLYLTFFDFICGLFFFLFYKMNYFLYLILFSESIE